MRDSNVIIVSTLLLLGWALFRAIDAFVGDAAGPVLQLVETLLIIAAVGLLVIKSFQIVLEGISSKKP